MTLRLILVRHAKSSWTDPALDDHARPLNGRGRRSAAAIGEWLARNGHAPDLVLSSDSARTRETWALIAPALSAEPMIEWRRELYHAGAQDMLDILRGAGTAQTVLMLGHNPGIAGFAGMLARRPHPHPRFRDFPTAATAVIEMDAAAWPAADWGTGTVTAFVVPRDLGAD